ncbi:Serine/threonine protein kinase, partial [Parasponia andersonii]
ILDASKKKRLTKIFLVVSNALGVSVFGSLIIWSRIWKSRTRTKGKREEEDLELPLFDFTTIATTTNNFSPSNMIGAGGFGPVYKGNLSTGQEIAVKRLSKNSGQGPQEFKNEIQLIAKLQHRNLVTLLGCCIQGEERMLIYEYMPNKSLDHFIFDHSKRGTILPWKKTFDIVKGIARGLLYLHRDSKLHIIHRDLKASNILLDNNLNPKISDFGLARMFEDDEKEGRTRRVVGTYGYMSPEYAIDGKFSMKSDVFSFGVLLLEIVSGKKNRRFHHPDHHHNLLGHAWLLWKEDRALNVMDACFKEYLYVESQVLRCIHIGLLCVQKFPLDRPTMSSVVFMLENEGAISTQPKQPGFFLERCSSVECSTSRNEEFYTENMITISVPNGR